MPFGSEATHCIPCALVLDQDVQVVVLALTDPAECVVRGCGEAGTVRDPLTGDLYCSGDAAAILTTLVALRRMNEALGPYAPPASVLAYEAYQGAADGELVFCTCGSLYERGGACNAVEPRDPALHVEVA